MPQVPGAGPTALPLGAANAPQVPGTGPHATSRSRSPAGWRAVRSATCRCSSKRGPYNRTPAARAHARTSLPPSPRHPWRASRAVTCASLSAVRTGSPAPARPTRAANASGPTEGVTIVGRNPVTSRRLPCGDRSARTATSRPRPARGGRAPPLPRPTRPAVGILADRVQRRGQVVGAQVHGDELQRGDGCRQAVEPLAFGTLGLGHVDLDDSATAQAFQPPRAGVAASPDDDHDGGLDRCHGRCHRHVDRVHAQGGVGSHAHGRSGGGQSRQRCDDEPIGPGQQAGDQRVTDGVDPHGARDRHAPGGGGTDAGNHGVPIAGSIANRKAGALVTRTDAR